MTMPVPHFAPVTQMNWPRIGALSGSLSMHLYVLALLLAPPIAIELLARAPSQRFVARFIAAPVPVPVESEPVLPLPARHATHHAVAAVPVTERVTETSAPAPATKVADSAALPGPSAPETSLDLAPDCARLRRAHDGALSTRCIAPPRARHRRPAGTGRCRRRSANRGDRIVQRFSTPGQCCPRGGHALEVPAGHAQRRDAQCMGARADRF